MEIRQAIDHLRSSLEHIIAEDELLGVINGHMIALRQSWRSSPSLFSSKDIEFLKTANFLVDHLRSFMELKDELASINSLEEYEDIVSRLNNAKCALAGFPVAKRVAKEIRELNERMPDILQLETAHRQFRISNRTLDLEQNPRRCPRQHPMVIRNGAHGHFWGCSRYPFCTATTPLTPEESDFLKP